MPWQCHSTMERLQRIQELFPREEEHNQELQKLYLAAGIEPHYVKSAAPAAPAAPAAAATTSHPAAPPAARPAASDGAEVSSLAKVAEITRKLYQQGNAEGVLKAAAHEIGANWRTARCIAALRKPGLPPSSVQDYHMEGLDPVSSAALISLVEALHDLAVARGTVTIGNARNAPELIEIRSAIEELQIESLLAIPLTEGNGNDSNNDQIGVLILTQNTGRVWQAAEILVIRTLSDQVLIALNNAGLRRLVKNLSVTDEKSGLMKRASYLDLLQAETRRGLQQGTAVTVLLMQFGRRSALIKEYGEHAVTAVMEQVGQLFAANIRTNDLAFRYEATTVALVLGDTGEKEALLAVEKFRRLLAEVRFPGRDEDNDKEEQRPAGPVQCRARPGGDAAEFRSGGHCDRSRQPRRSRLGTGRDAGRGKDCKSSAAVRRIGSGSVELSPPRR